MEKALKIEPNNADAHSLLAGLHVSLNQLNEAIESYEHVLALDPENREAELPWPRCMPSNANSPRLSAPSRES